MVFRKFLKQWFGYTRGERVGSFILLIILLVVLAIRALNSGSDPYGREEGEAGFKHADSSAVIPADIALPASDLTGSDSAVAGLSGAVSLSSGLAATGSTTVEAWTEGLGKSNPLYTFDPNTAGKDKLMGLGLSERQVRTIINYRSTGARFDEPEDFRKIYGIDREMQDRLIPYIIIAGPSQPEEPGRSGNRNEQFAEDGENHNSGLVLKQDFNSADSDEENGSGTVIRIDINHADSVDFENLAGIGPVLAGRIVKYRRLLGYFSCTSQLTEVYGLSTEVIDLYYNGFTCDSSLIRKININRASYSELLRHPYISRVHVEAIISYRRLSGSLTGIRDLVRNRILDREEAERLRPYLEFE